MLLDIWRFWADNALIYLSSRNFFLNTTNKLRHSPGWKTINCDENMFQMFFFIQQLFIWAHCMGPKQQRFQKSVFPRLWCERLPM